MICKICGRELSDRHYGRHYEKCNMAFKHIDDMKKMYCESSSYTKISKKYNINPTLTRDILIKNGVDKKELYKDLFDINFFKKESKKKYWLLGLLASDGNVHGSNNIISLSQSGDDGLEIIKYVANIIKYKNKIRTHKTCAKDAHSIHFSSKELKEILCKYNIVPKKSLTFSMKNIREDMVKYFMLGYIEGDGSITIQKNRNGSKYLSIETIGTDTFVSQSEKFLSENGFKTHIAKKSNGMSSFVIKCKKAQELCEWLYSDDEMYRGKKYRNFIESRSVTRTKFLKYDKIRNEIKDEVISNASHKRILELATEHKVAWQTIYSWKKEWKNG